MPTSTNAHEAIKPYEFHGLDLTKSNGQGQGDCPFCESEGHFFAGAKGWDCKKCGESGNAYGFLRLLLEESKAATKARDYTSLSRERGIPASILRDWGLAKSITSDDWLVPAFNEKGRLANLHRYTGGKLLSSPRCKLHPFGVQLFSTNKRHKTLWICEGAWDGMAWTAILGSAKVSGDIVALPGAGTCHQPVAGLCSNREVVLLLDADEAGRRGTDGLLSKLAAVSPAPASVRVLRWPKGLPIGYDVRDLLLEKGPKTAYRFVVKHLEEVNPSQEEKADEGELSTKRYCDIKPEDLTWLWPGRIPCGKLTLVQGNPGLGKSFAVLDIASRVTTGKPFPDGTPCPKGEVALFTCEDGAGDTIRPRLDLLGANVARVHHVDCVKRDGEEFTFSLSRDIRKLQKWIAAHPRVKLLIFDPLANFLGEKIDSHKNSDVRRLLGPLCKLAESHGMAVVGINHLAKMNTKAIHRGMGSVGFTAQARSVWQVSADPADPDRRLLLPVKMNLAKNCGGLAFAISDKGLRWERNPVVDITADQAEADEGTGTRLHGAADWLRSFLEERGETPAKQVIDAARREGIAYRTLRRAKDDLRIRPRSNGKSGWSWSLPTTERRPTPSTERPAKRAK